MYIYIYIYVHIYTIVRLPKLWSGDRQTRKRF